MKSAPELWTALSDPEGLAGHLGEFGEITIVRAEPQASIVWEADGVSGSVELEPSGFGTTVRLAVRYAAAAEGADPVAAEVEAEEDAPVAEVELEAVAEHAAVEAEEEDEAVPEVEAAAEGGVAGPAEPDVPSPSGSARTGGPRAFFMRLFRRGGKTTATTPASVEAPRPVLAAPAQAPFASPVPDRPEVELTEEAGVQAETIDMAPEAEAPDVAPEAETDAAPEAQPDAPALDPEHALAVLQAALDRLGAAHHRPFSRG